MPAIFFTDATDADGVRKEFVADLRNRAKSFENAAKSATGEKEKKAALALACELNSAAKHWEEVHIGHPARGGVGPVAAPQRAA